MADSARNIKKIHLIVYCHQDYSWTNTREWHMRRYIEFYGETLTLLGEYPGLTVTVDNYFHGMESFIRYCPERFDELSEYIREGRLSLVCGGATLVRPNNCGDELFIRNIAYFRRKMNELFGICGEPVYLNADTAFGHGQLPQILKKSGYELYRYMRPSCLDAKLPREFIYKGIDGTEIYTLRGRYGEMKCTYARQGQITDTVKDMFLSVETDDRDAELNPSGQLVVFIGGDDAKPLCDTEDTYSRLPEIVAEWNGYKNLKVKFSTLGGYLSEVKKASVRVISGVIEPCDMGFNLPMGGNEGLWFYRFALERELVRLEKTSFIAKTLGISVCRETLERLWVELMEFSGHAMEFALEADYKRILADARKALTEAEDIRNELEDRLTESFTAGGDNEYLLINVNSFEMESVIPLHITSAHNLRGFNIIDESGNNVPYQLCDLNHGGKSYPLAEYTEAFAVCRVRVPSFGCRMLSVLPDGGSLKAREARDITAAAKTDETVSICSGELSVVFSKGLISSVTCGGKEIYSADCGKGFSEIELRETVPGSSWTLTEKTASVSVFRPEKWHLAENGPLRWKYISEGTVGDCHVRQITTLYAGSRRIDFRTELFVGAEGVEGYFTVVFPYDTDGGILSGIPFGAEERNISDEAYGSSERSVPGAFFSKHFTAFRMNGSRVALLQGNCGIYCIADAENGTLGLCLSKGIKTELRQSGWVRLMDSGKNMSGKSAYEYSFAVPKDGSVRTLYHFSYEAEFPVTATARLYTRKQGHECPFSAMKVTDGVFISSIYEAENGTVLRIFNPSDEALETKLAPKINPKAVKECPITGIGEYDIPITVNAVGELKMVLSPYEIKTLKLL